MENRIRSKNWLSSNANYPRMVDVCFLLQVPLSWADGIVKLPIRIDVYPVFMRCVVEGVYEGDTGEVSSESVERSGGVSV
jgi:hypothetical protein